MPLPRGYIYTDEHKKKISQAKIGKKRPEISKMMRGERNSQWKGNSVGWASVHTWVRNHLPQPEFCQMCNIMPPFDLANVTGVYARGFENWKYYCRACHMISDGRMMNNLGHQCV